MSDTPLSRCSCPCRRTQIRIMWLLYGSCWECRRPEAGSPGAWEAREASVKNLGVSAASGGCSEELVKGKRVSAHVHVRARLQVDVDVSAGAHSRWMCLSVCLPVCLRRPDCCLAVEGCAHLPLEASGFDASDTVWMCV